MLRATLVVSHWRRFARRHDQHHAPGRRYSLFTTRWLGFGGSRLREEKRLLSLLRKQALDAQCEEMASQLAARQLPAVVCLTYDASSGSSNDGWVFLPAVVVASTVVDGAAAADATLTALGSDNRWYLPHSTPPPLSHRHTSSSVSLSLVIDVGVGARGVSRYQCHIRDVAAVLPADTPMDPFVLTATADDAPGADEVRAPAS